MSERELRAAASRIDARSRPLARDVLALLQRFAKLVEWRAIEAARRKATLPMPRVRLAKADTDDSLEAELARILRVYGSQQAGDAAKRVGADGVPDEFVQRLAKRAVYTAQQILARTNAEVTRSVNRVIVEGLAEDPPATVADIAKRIREQFHGAGAGAPGSVTDRTVRTGRTERLSTDKGVLYWISSERAATIARTEIGEAEESGKVAGYEAIGAWGMEWLSRQWPQGRHQTMNGKKVRMGAKFQYPDGSTGSYPRSPDSPVKHRVNCQCTTKPIFKRGR